MLNRVREFRKKLQIKHQLGTSLFLFALVLYLVLNLLQASTYKYVLDNNLLYLGSELSALIALIKIILFNKFRDYQELLIITLIGLVVWTCSLNSWTYNYIYYYIFVIAAKDEKIESILKIFITTVSVMLGVLFLSAKFGLIVGIVTSNRPGSSTLRYALGTMYATDLAARIFYVWLFYVLLRKFTLKFPEYIIGLSLCASVYIVTDTRVDTVLIALTLLLSLAKNYVMPLVEKVGSKIINYIIVGVISLMIILTYIYNPDKPFPVLRLINKALNYRLTWGHLAFDRYNVSFFGQYIYEVGSGGLNHRATDNYFFIDDSYVRILMFGGFFFFIIFLVGIVFLVKRAFEQGAISIVIALILIILSSIIDHHMPDMGFNVIFLALFGNLDYLKEKVKHGNYVPDEHRREDNL